MVQSMSGATIGVRGAWDGPLKIDSAGICRPNQLYKPSPAFGTSLIMNLIANCSKCSDRSFNFVRHNHEIEVGHQPNSAPLVSRGG
ncbi:hypothetical protein ACVWWP_003112 [Bradyrhizobium sp. LM3.6]